jgi:hypothetical protein
MSSMHPPASTKKTPKERRMSASEECHTNE